MKPSKVSQLLIATAFIAMAIITPSSAKAEMTVTQEKHNGWEVTAVREVAIRSPEGKMTVLSEPFKTKDTDWTPSGPIQCEWSPDGMVAVFTQQPRVTEIYVFNTKTGKCLKETFQKKKMPAWYDNVAIVHDSPDGKWNGGRLGISSKVTLRNTEKHVMKQVLVISGETFSLK